MLNIKSITRLLHHDVSAFNPGLADLTVDQIKKKLGKDSIYKLSFNENPLGPSQKVISAMIDAVKQANLYQDSNGDELKQAIAIKEGIQPERLLLSNGADEMILMLAQTFLSPDDEVIIPTVTFGQYAYCTHLMGAKPIFTPMTEELHIDLSAILRSITEKTKLIFLCNPNNPTGGVLTTEAIKQFLEQVPPQVLVVIDEAYHEYVSDPAYSSAVKLVNEDKPLFVIRTFSKIYALAGARVGYGIGSENLVKEINRVRQPFNVNGIAQAAALASLTDEQHVIESLQLNEQGKEKLYSAFKELNVHFIKSETNFVYADLGVDSQTVFEALAEQGIIVRTLQGYGLKHSIRVSIGNEIAMDTFIKSLKEILKK